MSLQKGCELPCLLFSTLQPRSAECCGRIEQNGPCFMKKLEYPVLLTWCLKIWTWLPDNLPAHSASMTGNAARKLFATIRSTSGPPLRVWNTFLTRITGTTACSSTCINSFCKKNTAKRLPTSISCACIRTTQITTISESRLQTCRRSCGSA